MAFGRDVEPVVDIPSSDNLDHYHQQQRESKIHDERGIENLADFAPVLTPEFVAEEPLGGGGERSAHKGKHYYDRAYNIVDAVIVNAQSIKDYARCIELYYHRDAHAHVEKQCVSGDSSVV